ncbi:MAG: 5-nucleotidase, partial [Acetobacteraceae bacterium]|nr:5-nucleotidase [Acetobacteraceae bacterium]
MVKLLARRVKYLAKGGKDEGMLSFDPISPLKPHLGADYGSLVSRLRTAIETRYSIPAWND